MAKLQRKAQTSWADPEKVVRKSTTPNVDEMRKMAGTKRKAKDT